MKNVTRILIAEHDVRDIELLQRELKKSGIKHVSEIVGNEKEFTKSLLNFKPDIILSDYSFPSFNAPAAFEIKQKLVPDVPFIIVSGTIGEENSIELIKNGITDFVLKDNMRSLTNKINRALREAGEKRQRKQAEEQTVFERKNLDALINNTNDLMWSVDKQFRLIASNHPFNELVKKLSVNTVSGGSNILIETFSKEQLNRYKFLYMRAFAGETFTEIEYVVLPEEKWSEISFSPIRKGDEIIGTACYSRNITDLKREKINLEKQNRELVKVNAELDRFVYSTSHDLRSPLTSVLGLTSLIEKETNEPHILKYAQMICTSVNRLDDFIKNILNYSKNNRTGLDIKKIPLKKTVNEIVNALRNTTDAEGIAFEIKINERQPFYTDEQRFNTVLENLIANAIKYHKKNCNGRYIKITCESGKENLYITIEDNGVGIAPEYHVKIFDMFFRLPSKTAGSGFGLYMVKEIIEKLHGSIRVNSAEGTGSSFIIKLKNLIAMIEKPAQKDRNTKIVAGLIKE